MSTKITMEHVKKVYNGNIVVIPDLSAMIKPGEFFTLLGPSGCGKTTLLRMIAGFNSIEGGEIKFGEQVINQVPAYRRNIGMVFQNYAVFPHMTVRENIEYGLKIKEPSKEKRKQRCDAIMETVKIMEHAEKRPDQMSGGQQQRVALARAIVISPNVLLMDEPLSNLDAKLRIEMRSVIRDIQKRVGITTVYVTHDQEEALAVSDRIAVMESGEIQQVNTPQEIYQRPFNTMVASFIGRSNVLDAQMRRNGSIVVIDVNGYCFEMDNVVVGEQNQAVKLVVRPEEFVISREGNGLDANVRSGIFLGKYTNYEMVLNDGTELEVSLDSSFAKEFYKSGEWVKLEILANKVNLFTANGERSLIEGVKRYAE